VRDLSVEFTDRGVRALDEVSLEIGAGERVALLGPSGAGKSTLLRALLGAVPATGTVRVGGRNPYHPREVRVVRRATGFLRQGDDLILAVSARLNALLGTLPQWRPPDWARALTGQVPRGWADQLAELADRHGVTECLVAPAGKLSGGQRQRVALIRALLPGPRLLLADEPTTGLDPVTAAEAVRALHGAVGSERSSEASDAVGVAATVLAATHDATVAATFDRVVALRDGRLVYDGPPLDSTTTAQVYGVVP
jgi:ABC-type phosphate/phosphonate transport system ATPase subunit